MAFLIGSIVGMALLLPSLWLLFADFKGRNPVLGMRTGFKGASHGPASASHERE